MEQTEPQDVRDHDEERGRSARRSFMMLTGAAAAGGAASLVGASPAEAVGPVDGGTATAPIDLIKARRASANAWFLQNPTLAEGEPGVETTTGRVKFGRMAGSPAALQAWNDLPYADTQTSNAVQSHLNQQVTLDGINAAVALRGSEKVLGLQQTGPPPTNGIDAMIDVDQLRSYGRADVYQALAATGDLTAGTTLVLGYAASAYALRLPTYTAPVYADRTTTSEPWRVRIIQLDVGKIEIAKTLVSGSPNPDVTIGAYALTQAAAAAAAATPPQTAPTRIRTKGQWAVAVAEAIIKLGNLTVWVVSGDVEAF